MSLKWDKIKYQSKLDFNQSDMHTIDFGGKKGTITVKGDVLWRMLDNHRLNVARPIALEQPGTILVGQEIFDKDNRKIDVLKFLPSDYK